MEITMGRDQGVISELKKVSETIKKGLLTKRIIKVLTFEITVRNNTKGIINLTLEDQIPITENEEIKIELVNGGDSILNENTGKLTWKLNLKPGQKKVITFSYSVEHDEGKPVS